MLSITLDVKIEISKENPVKAPRWLKSPYSLVFFSFPAHGAVIASEIQEPSAVHFMDFRHAIKKNVFLNGRPHSRKATVCRISTVDMVKK